MSKESLNKIATEVDGAELTIEQLSMVSGGINETALMCPHCGSRNITPYHSPTKGKMYLCCECYNSFVDNEKR